MGEAQSWRFDAAIAPRQIGHVHQIGDGVEQRERDMRALTGARPPQQRLEDRGIGGLPGGDVDDRDADARRPRAFIAGDRGEPGLGLHQQIIGLAAIIRTVGRIARDVAGDQPRMALAQRRAADAQAVGRSRRQVLDEHIRLRQHRLDHGEVAGLLQVDPAGFLAAVDPDEIGGEALGVIIVAAREIAFRPLKLDHSARRHRPGGRSRAARPRPAPAPPPEFLREHPPSSRAHALLNRSSVTPPAPTPPSQIGNFDKAHRGNRLARRSINSRYGPHRFILLAAPACPCTPSA